MNLHEYQSKQLLENFDLPTAKSVVAFSAEEISSLISELDGEEFVVKVQVHAGGRGKAGGVKITKDIDEIIEFLRIGLERNLSITRLAMKESQFQQ